MRSTDRDYFLSTLSVLHSQRHSIIRTLQDMNMRLEELEESLIMMFNQQEENSIDMMLDDAWQAGFDYTAWNEDDVVIYDSLRNKQCKCKENNNPNDYRMD